MLCWISLDPSAQPRANRLFFRRKSEIHSPSLRRLVAANRGFDNIAARRGANARKRDSSSGGNSLLVGASVCYMIGSLLVAPKYRKSARCEFLM
jgi:hypothetical protein